MIVIFTAVVLILLVIGALHRRFQEATLHWGRVMAGLGELERQIQAAKDAGNVGQASELIGRSVHHRGLQDELTSPSQINLTIGYWVAWLGTFAWGFFVLPWYIALLWPIFFGMAKRKVKNWLPAPSSEHYQQKIIGSLTSRRDRFLRTGDTLKANMSTVYIEQLRQLGNRATEQHPSEEF